MTPREHLLKAATRARDKARRDYPGPRHRCPQWEPCGYCAEPDEDDFIASWCPDELAALAPLLDGTPTPGALFAAGWICEGEGPGSDDGCWWHLKCYWLTLDASMRFDL